MLTDPPLVTLDEVYHVGTLDPADRKSASYEGDGLSVSLHPDDWTRIARLPGATWVLRKPGWEKFRFVSYHDLTDADLDALRDWGRARGWVCQRTVYRISWFDDEWDDQMYMDLDTETEARYEAEHKADDEDIDAAITPVLVWRPTPSFPDKRVGTDCDPTDALLSAFIRETRPDLDGVWWSDDHDVVRLSAPRGVLVHDLSGYARHEMHR